MKPLKKRPTIGLLVSGLTEYFTVSLCRGVMQAAEAADVNLIVLPGKNIDRDFSCYPKIMYEYQYGTLFEYPSPENLDAVIVSAAIPQKKVLAVFFPNIRGCPVS